MLVRSLILCSALVGLPSFASAQSTAEWRGLASVSAVTETCELQQAAYVGSRYLIRFRAPNIGGNDNTTRWTMIDDFYSQNYLAQGTVGNAFVDVEAGSLSTTVNIWSGSQMRFTIRNPTTITANTTFLTIVGQIRSFDDYPGCTITFNASLTRRLP